MKRWLVFLVAVGAIACVVMGVHIVREKRALRELAQREREVAYQAALRSYSDVITPGMTRKEVEDYLGARNVSFRQMCCVDRKEFSKDVYDDLTKIGEEDAPWVCNEKNIYIAFQFRGTQTHERESRAEASDRLSSVSLYRSLEGCP
jgi:hypothetical protein